MENTVRNRNSLTLYAITCLMLFISSMGFIMGYKSGVAAQELSYTSLGFVLFAAATSLLVKAIKQDINEPGRA
jgi:hypothetical protein